MSTEKTDNWCVAVSTASEYANVVRFIADHGWPCSEALKEQNAFDHPEHVFWNPQYGMLWRGRWEGCPNIDLAEMIVKMKAIHPHDR